MQFSEFIQRLSSVLRGGSNTSAFTKSVLEAILTDEGQEILDGYSSSSFKNFYNGNTSVTNLAKKVNAYIEPLNFSDYIEEFQESVIQNLCDQFADVLPDVDIHNAGDQLANYFIGIITEAAGNKKRGTSGGSTSKGKEKVIVVQDIPFDIFDPFRKEDVDPFDEYLEKAIEFYSLKKTLINPEKPRSFNDIYVCNDLRYHKWRTAGIQDTKQETRISNGTVEKLEKESKYIVIEGTGGIGKSMYLTHLFLSAAEEYFLTDKIPVFISLKDYKDSAPSIVELICKAVKEFDEKLSREQIINLLEEKNLILLLDGLDEIQSSLYNSFREKLESFIKSYYGNTVFITSRPIYSFVSFTQFSLFDIEPLTKEQAVALIEKLEFWDDVAKSQFIIALQQNLYWSHREFASNPLLLTIMLMTYSSFGEVPGKMHVFYAKAYETMARLHDATKGSFRRPLHTGLTPENFAKYFAEFCARTYAKELFDFDELSFSFYMDKVLRGAKVDEVDITPRDFLQDLTDNLCIMYREGEKYYFIHRSFQEYFAAAYFASGYDSGLKKVGKFFEGQQHRSYTDRTFDMLYDMIPEKVERYIFMPFLEDCFKAWGVHGQKESYWEYLEDQYPVLYHETGRTEDICIVDPQSFLYKTIVHTKDLFTYYRIEGLNWPDQIEDLPRKNWVSVHQKFTDPKAFDTYPDPEMLDDVDLGGDTLIPEDELDDRYIDYFGEPDVKGFITEIDIYDLRKYPDRYAVLRRFIEDEDFPLVEEYRNVRQYYMELKHRALLEDKSDDLFDDE